MIRVLVVDDSALVRKILTEELSRFPDIQVVGTATDPYVARDKLLTLQPDVITLDIEMPRMDGLSFLARVMQHCPTPVIIVSSVAPERGATAIRALALGAVDVVSKPGSGFSVPEVETTLVRAIRAAASARVRSAPKAAPFAPSSKRVVPAESASRVIAIGASTGGTVAIEQVLRALPANAPGIVIVQHLPPSFTRAFADRLNGVAGMEVREARDGEALHAGLALIAPGDKHLILQRDGARCVVAVRDGARVHHQRPAVDVLFQSVARVAGRNGVAALLTGMGADGATGMLAVRKAGGYTIAQDEESCVVFGMPREAIRLGAAVEVTPLARIPDALLEALSRRRAVPAA